MLFSSEHPCGAEKGNVEEKGSADLVNAHQPFTKDIPEDDLDRSQQHNGDQKAARQCASDIQESIKKTDDFVARCHEGMSLSPEVWCRRSSPAELLAISALLDHEEARAPFGLGGTNKTVHR